MTKKGQIQSRIFIYAVAVILGALILLFGYNAIKTIYIKGEQAAQIKFETSLQNSIEALSSSYGSVDIKTFKLPLKYSQLCFTSVTDKKELPRIFVDLYPLIGEAVETGDNVFLIGKDFDSFKVGKLELTYNVYCTSIVNGKVKLRIEGRTNSAFISSTESISMGIPKEMIGVYDDLGNLDEDVDELLNDEPDSLDSDIDSLIDDLEDIFS